jgi:hypothetical protein
MPPEVTVDGDAAVGRAVPWLKEGSGPMFRSFVHKLFSRGATVPAYGVEGAITQGPEPYGPSSAQPHLRAFIALVLSPLGPRSVALVTRHVVEGMRPEEGVVAALTRGFDDAVEEVPASVHLSLSHNDTAEVTWQVDRAMASLGSFARWDGPTDERAALPAVLAEATTWLQRKGYALLDIATGNDDCFAVVVPTAERKEAIAAAARAGLAMATRA